MKDVPLLSIAKKRCRIHPVHGHCDSFSQYIWSVPNIKRLPKPARMRERMTRGESGMEAGAKFNSSTGAL
jgi:hypothetical protein